MAAEQLLLIANVRTVDYSVVNPQTYSSEDQKKRIRAQKETHNSELEKLRENWILVSSNTEERVYEKDLNTAIEEITLKKNGDMFFHYHSK